MRKKVVNGKRILAFALAVSLVFGEAAGSAATVKAAEASEETVVETTEPASDTAVEEQAEAASDTAAEEQTEAASDTAAEEQTEAASDTAEEETEEDLEVDTNEAYGTPADKPGVVTNLRWTKADGKEDTSELLWDNVQGAEKYELRVTDAAGNEYAKNRSGDELQYDSTGELFYFVDELEYYMYKKNAAGVWERGDGISYGQTYNIYVRAVNNEADGESFDETKGDWSAPISWTVSGTTVKLPTGVVVDYDNKRVRFSSDPSNSIEMSIKDSKGQEYFASYIFDDKTNAYVPDYRYLYNDFYSFSDGKFGLYLYDQKTDASGKVYYERRILGKDAKGWTIYATPTTPGETYTISFRSYGYNNAGEKVTSAWTTPVSFVYPAEEVKTPAPTKDVKYLSGENKIDWKAVRNVDGYEVSLKDTAGNSYTKDPDDDKAASYGNITESSSYLKTNGWDSFYVYEKDANGNYVIKKNPDGTNMEAFQPNTTYTVQVRTYNETADGTRLYSEYTPVYTFTIKTDMPAVTKITGVYVSSKGVYWNEEENAKLLGDTSAIGYEIAVTSADGREFTAEPEKNDAGVYEAFGYICYNSTFASCTDLQNNLRIYVDENGKKIPLEDANGYAVEPFANGQTYAVKVRAFRKVWDGTRVCGEWSSPFTYTAPSQISKGINAVPAKVTGLVLKTEDEGNKNTSGLLSYPTLRWNKQDNVHHYEFLIKDSKGNVYTRYYKLNGTYIEDYSNIGGYKNSCTVQELSGIRAYINVNDPALAMTTVKDANGKDVKTFDVGETYSISVRAVNVYNEWDAAAKKWKDSVYNYGEWSNAVTYKPLSASALTALRYVTADDEYYYFTFKAKQNDSVVWYQVAEDAQFSDTSVVTDWKRADQDDNAFLRIEKNSNVYKPGVTYYVRAVNYSDTDEHKKPFTSLKDEEINALVASGVVTFTGAVDKKSQKTITDFRVYKETAEHFEFRWSGKLDSKTGDRYAVQISTTMADDSWQTIIDGEKYGDDEAKAILNKNELNEGITYVRLKTYTTQKNELTGLYDEVFVSYSNIVSVKVDRATSKISKLVLKRKTEDGVEFTFSGTVNKSQSVKYELCDNKNFNTNQEYDNFTGYADTVNNKFFVNYSYLIPGRTYYVRARVENDKASSDDQKYSAYTNVVRFKTAIPAVSVAGTAVTKNSVTLEMSRSNSDYMVTGYEIQRKSGKKWIEVAKTTSTSYTEKKLKANTTYTYRVRAYYFNPKTKKSVNGTWEVTEATTWGGAVNAKAKAAGKTSIKITWSKVSGAEGYEVYRYIGDSNETQVSNGQSNEYGKYKLVKSAGAKTKSYTDKKLTKDMTYSYKVVAYKKIGDKKVTIESFTRPVCLGFELWEISEVQKSTGKVVWSWSPVYSAKGYLVEKYNNVTGKWSTYKKIKKAKTGSITLPKSTDNKGTKYRLRAYSSTKNGAKYTNEITCIVKPVLKTPTGVKAKKSNKTGKITVTWKKVKGADYYVVYRTTNPWTVYNKDLKGYEPSNATAMDLYIADASRKGGYRVIKSNDTEELKEYYKDGGKLKFVDTEITVTEDGVTNVIHEGPKTGVTYYYYVVAYKNGKAYNYDNQYDGDPIRSLYSKPVKATLNETAPKASKLSSVKAASKKITIKYKKVAGADGYEIYRSTSKKKGFVSVGVVNSETKLSFVDKNSKKNSLKKGKTYYYKVRAFVYNDAGEKVYSKYSKVKSVKAK